MTQYQITLNEQTLQRLFGADSQLAALVEAILNQVLDAQVSEQVGAERYERTDERHGYRNGYKPRQLTTRVGTLTLRVPQVREGAFSTELFARYQRSEQALILTLMEMVVNGVSTRKVARITEELCGREFAKSTGVSLAFGGAGSALSVLDSERARLQGAQPRRSRGCAGRRVTCAHHRFCRNCMGSRWRR